ncbi:OTU domain-containing protein 6, partial [Lecanoromycetidae sp. Uapishka_2]
MEDLQKRHRQEQKDLQAKVTQKKKSATKKSRKGVNDECAELDRQLKEQQQTEISALADEEDSTRHTDEDLNAEVTEVLNAPESLDINEAISSLSVSTTSESNGQAKKPNRQKARLARRAAEQEAAAQQAQREAAELPNLRDQERVSMREAYTLRGLKEHEIRSDGHCLYAAVADQLQILDLGLNPKIKVDALIDIVDHNSSMTSYKATRQVAAAFIAQNPDDFAPFLDEPLDQYVKTIRDTGEWGGHLELLALAKAYEVDINVLHGDGKVDKVECGSSLSAAQLWLAYYRHIYGLGEHYNSLRRAL